MPPGAAAQQHLRKDAVEASFGGADLSALGNESVNPGAAENLGRQNRSDPSVGLTLFETESSAVEAACQLEFHAALG